MCCRGVVGCCIQVERRWWEGPEVEGFQAGSVSSRWVSAGAKRQGAYGGSARHEHERSGGGALSHAVEGVV